jgi:hypothetical protein
MKLREGVSFSGCQRLFVEYFLVWGRGQGSVGVVSAQFVLQEVEKKSSQEVCQQGAHQNDPG